MIYKWLINFVWKPMQRVFEDKYGFLTDKDVLLEKYLLEKIATMKRFEYSEYSSLGKELKAQNDIEQKQHQNLDDTFRFDKIIKKEEPA